MLPTEPPISPTRAELTVESHSGQVVVVKRVGPAGVPRLRREADVLARAQGAGVVRLVACGDDADGAAWMTTAWVGTHTLATVALGGTDHVADLVATVAGTVADLHDRGIVHGCIRPEHVVIGTDGRPVLVGFGRGVVDGAPVDGAGDELAPPADGPTRSDDVEALGALALELLARLEVPAAARRRADDLAAAARTAANPDRWARPSARRLAAMIAGAEPAVVPPPASSPGPAASPSPVGEYSRPASADVPPDAPDPPARPSGPNRNATIQLSRGVGRREAPVVAAPVRRRWPVVVGVVAALIALASVAALVGFRDDGTATAPDATSPSPGDPVLPTTASPATTAAPPPTTPSTAPPAPAPPNAPRTVVQPGGSLTWEGRTYELGDAGDEVTVGDFACTRRPMAVVLRPASGEVFAFRDWAVPGVDVHAGVASTVPSGSRIEPSIVDGRGCAPLTVRLPGGDVATVVLTDPPPPAVPNGEGGT